MLESKLEKFLAKRVFIALVLLSILAIVFLRYRWFVFLGLVIGGSFSVIRFSTTASTYRNILVSTDETRAARRSVLRYILSQAVVVTMLVAAVVYNIWLFAGAAAGILLVPSILFIYAITEGLGITHNNFE